MTCKNLLLCVAIPACGIAAALTYLNADALHGGSPVPAGDTRDAYVKRIQPLLKKYCFECHTKKVHKGGLDLERFDSLTTIRKDLKPWQHLIEQVEAREMPLKGKPQPSEDERKLILAWTRTMLDAEARAHTGDPGRVPMRRLSNAEYDCTIRDLTGIALRPTREFPADGAGGEGFTNAAESLTDITPTLFTRYLDAAKDIADHAVLLPDGFRFSPGKTRRDWTNESTSRLREFYAGYTADGRLAFRQYLLATLRHRDGLTAGKISVAEVAVKEKLNPKYLQVLWQTLTDKTSSDLLDRLRARWRVANEKDAAPLAAEIADWQKAIWKLVPVGSYVASVRQVANDPVARDAVPIKLAVKPSPAQKEVVLYLASRELSSAGKGRRVVWQRPHFEGKGKEPLLLKDVTDSGLPKERFTDANVVGPPDAVIEVRLPVALFRDREFVVEGKLEGEIGERVVLFQATTAPPARALCWDGKSPVVAAPTSTTFKRMLTGFDDFRRCFPWFLCFPNVVPTDEVVCLKMFHREDEPLERLFLDAEQKRGIDHLWAEHRFISQQAAAENAYLPQFIGFVTQDQPKSLVEFFEKQRPDFKKRADEFGKDALAAEPTHVAALADFAARAYRRPLADKEKAGLLDLYQKLRKKGVSHDEAFRGVLTRVLVAPAFLFRIEKAPPGTKAGPIDDWELATRLSYFLWASAPDDELRQLASAGKLRDPKVLADQTRRMMKDDRLRSLAIEFGTQWIHVRNFDSLKEKNEKLFPTFNPTLRKAIYEESILFFLDLFQSDRAVTQILDADYTFLDDTLAKHYGIPGVNGPQWRRVDGVRKYGRGGVLGLASVHARQSGASRTSPVLRGNWVVETLLGEKLPRPPANVPVLPDEEGGTDKRTTRQQVERHVSDASCAACHVRIDPYGFAFENFDAIGRFRTKEVGGLPVDVKAKLKDGTEFEGIDGLRSYLLTKKKEVIVRLFCQRLLGYALGRATTLSDTSLLDEMVAELNKNDGRLSAAVLTIVRSPQFRMIRGSDFAE